MSSVALAKGEGFGQKTDISLGERDTAFKIHKMPTKDEIIEAIKTIEDPELFLDIWFLGLIYNIGIDADSNEVDIEMTFTTPACPAAPSLVQEVHDKVGALDGVEKVNVNIVFTPPWEPSDDVKAMLGMI